VDTVDVEKTEKLDGLVDIFSLRKIVSKNIRFFMIERNVNQKEMANRCGVGVCHISLIMNRKRLPSWKLLTEICNILKCKIEDIITEKDKNDVNVSNVVQSIKNLLVS